MPKPKPKPRPANPSQKDESTMTTKQRTTYPAHVPQDGSTGQDEVVNQAADEVPTEQRGAGTGEEAVITRERNYDETVPGAFPAVVSPTREQKAMMQEQQKQREKEQAETLPIYEEKPRDPLNP
jgi:hypothetical protein